MTTYCADVETELTQAAPAWARLRRDQAAAVLGEYRHLAESMAGQFGCQDREFHGFGHHFRYASADAAVRFAVRLVEAWGSAESGIPIRVGCHFGERAALGGIRLARQLLQLSEEDSVTVTGTVIDLIDLPVYTHRALGSFELAGDHLPSRPVYSILAYDREVLETREPGHLTAEQWFLKGASMIGGPDENSPAEAEAYLAAIGLRPAYPEAHNNLGALLKASGDAVAAEDHYMKALEVRADYPEGHYNYALLLLSTGRPTEAADHFRSAIALREEYVEAHHALAGLQRRRGDLATAEAHYRKAIALRPNYPEAHNDLAVLLESRGLPEQAEGHYQAAIRVRVGYPEAHYNYALLLEAREDPAAAIEQYRAAVEVWPDFVEAHNNLAALLQAGGEPERAAQHYEAAIRIRPTEPTAHYNYGLLLRSLGRSDAARERFEEASRLAGEQGPTAAARNRLSAVPIRLDGRVRGRSTELTGRESEVAALVSEGMTNRRIAERLFISDRTAETHVVHILNKLGFSSRAQIAAWHAQKYVTHVRDLTD